MVATMVSLGMAAKGGTTDPSAALPFVPWQLAQVAAKVRVCRLVEALCAEAAKVTVLNTNVEIHREIAMDLHLLCVFSNKKVFGNVASCLGNSINGNH
ncbi:MAG: hypothetical protein ACKVOO_07230 [Burkholderiaceae bacterium]